MAADKPETVIEGMEAWECFIEDRVLPHIDEIVAIQTDGDIAAVVERVDPKLEAGVRSIGWDGAARIFRMAGDAAQSLAGTLEQLGQPLEAAWLRRREPGTGRIFVVVDDQFEMLNVDVATGEIWFEKDRDPEPKRGQA